MAPAVLLAYICAALAAMTSSSSLLLATGRDLGLSDSTRRGFELRRAT